MCTYIHMQLKTYILMQKIHHISDLRRKEALSQDFTFLYPPFLAVVSGFLHMYSITVKCECS